MVHDCLEHPLVVRAAARAAVAKISPSVLNGLPAEEMWVQKLHELRET